MACMKQTARKGNKGLPKATQGGKGHGSGGGSVSGTGRGCGCGGDGNRNGNGNGNGNGDGKGKVPGRQFMKQLVHRPPPAVPKQKKPYVRAFQEMRKLQRTTKLCISKYQMARRVSEVDFA